MVNQIDNNQEMEEEKRPAVREEQSLPLSSKEKNADSWISYDPAFMAEYGKKLKGTIFGKKAMVQTIGNCEKRLQDIAQNRAGLNIYDALAIRLGLETTGWRKFRLVYAPLCLIIVSLGMALILFNIEVMENWKEESDRARVCFGFKKDFEFSHFAEQYSKMEKEHIWQRVIGTGLSYLLSMRVRDRCDGLRQRGLYKCIHGPNYIALPAFISVKLLKIGYVMNALTLAIALGSSDILIFISDDVFDMIANCVVLWFLVELVYYLVSTSNYDHFEEALKSTECVAKWKDNGEEHQSVKFVVYKSFHKWVWWIIEGFLYVTILFCHFSPLYIAACY